MNFDLKTEQLSDGAYVISLAGEVDLYTAPEFKQQLLAVLALAASGCGAVGRVTSGDPSHGKQLFLQAAKPSEPSCASCHTLADAKSTGTIGPNLDDAFASDKEQLFSQQTIKDVVRGQIA